MGGGGVTKFEIRLGSARWGSPELGNSYPLAGRLLPTNWKLATHSENEERFFCISYIDSRTHRNLISGI